MRQSRKLSVFLLLCLAGVLTLSLAIAPGQAAASSLFSATPDHGTGDDGREAGHQKQIVGYFIEWGVYARQYFVKNIVTSGSAAKLTTINYAFGSVKDNACGLADPYADYDKFFDATTSVDGVADSWDAGALRGNFHQLQKLKSLYPKLKVLISLGGWTGSGGFSSAAQPANVSSFVASCISTFITDSRWAGLFDGIDIDWEYPAACGLQCGPAEDTPNFTGMLAEFRRQLNGVRPGLLLTIAAPAAKDKYSKIELNKVQHYLNWINLLTYDFHVPSEPRTNFQSALFDTRKDPDRALDYNVNDVVNGYVRAGVSPRKLVVGIPFYGHGWQGVPNKNNGLYQPATGPAPGTYEAGSEDYKVLKNLEATYGTFWDREAQAFWIYNPTTGIFWTYDNPRAVANKGQYIKDKFGGLGGGMFWELSGDDSQGSLLTALYNSLHSNRD
jgi:chitinase